MDRWYLQLAKQGLGVGYDWCANRVPELQQEASAAFALGLELHHNGPGT